MLGSAEPVVVLASARPDEARRFYEDLLGLPFVGDDGFALVFRSGRTRVRITKVPDLTPQPFTVLDWPVDDIARAVSTLRSAGVDLQRYPFLEPGTDVWTAPDGTRVAWFTDPDGNILSVSQERR